MKNYLDLNRQSWNARLASHVASDFYNMEAFMAGENSLRKIELALLGEVTNKKILHLQCHFGQDSLSLARMGAKVTGVDLSDAAIAKAKEINDQLGLDATFINCDVYSAKDHIDEKFDIVFTSYGTIGWLPNLDQWADIVSYFLKPGGHFVMADFHPVVWMMDDDFTEIKYRYSKSEAIVEQLNGTYADTEAKLEGTEVSWNHGMAEIITALLKQGLQLKDFQEYDYSPYNCFNKTVKLEEDKYRIEHLDDKIPMVYSLVFSVAVDR